jgi:fatty acid desaturase
MAYVFTNHGLNPFCEINDPLGSSTSVEVHPVFDKLHHNFSYHTEHHLFPGMNSDYYPEVGRILKEKYPDRYNRIPFVDAWRRLWKNNEFLADDKGQRSS